MKSKMFVCNALLFLLIIGTCAGEVFAQAPVPSGIVAWYAGDGDARDNSGSGNNGTLQNGVSYAVGKVGQAFQLGGNGNASNSGDRVIVGNPANLQLQTFTIEAWVKRSSATIVTNSPVAGVVNGTIFAYGQGGYAFYIKADNRLAFGQVGVSEIITPNFTVTDTNWHHVAVSFNGSQAVFYLDDVADTPINYAATFAYTTNAAIGARGDSDARNAFFGAVDELTIYNRALSLAEIQSIYNAGVNGKIKQAVTNAGANVQTQVNDATLTFTNVSAGGTTTDYTINPTTAGALPTGFVQTGLAYNISTTAAYSGNVQTCFNLPALSSIINSVHIFHSENNALVDRTSSTNAATNTVCASVSSLSPFVVAFETVRQGQLIYNRYQASASVDGTIWAIFPDGTDDHQITTGSNPRLSPNGNYLAFKRKHSVSTDQNFQYGLWVMNLTTGVATEIFYQGDYLVGFDFTPDGSKLVFDWGCVVYRINLDGSNLTTLVNSNCFDDSPTVNPIGGRLAFHSQAGIFTTSDDTGANRQQVPNTGQNDLFPSWSKDGQFLAYVHYDGSSPSPYFGDNLYKIKPDGTGKVLLKTLTGTDRFGITGAWSPDGTKIYMPARIGGISGIYAVATDGSGTIVNNAIAAGSNVESVGGINGLVPTAPRATFDFDGDGKSDVSYWNPSNHNWYIQQSSNNTLRTQLDWGNGALGDIAVPRDYDGDGKCDIAVFRPSEGNWYIIQSQSNTVRSKNWGSSTDKLVPADYDGDGKVDIAIFRPSEGNWYIINSATNTITLRNWGTSTDIPVPGFYDSDAKADIAIYRPSEGNWYILNSLTNTVRVVNWGNGADQPVPADFDGDGRTDIAVFRPTGRVWYINLSNGGSVIKHWGDPGDILVPADYDGDGKADISVYRPSGGGQWWIIQSGTNTLANPQFGFGGSGVVPAPSTFIP